ncbi:MAG: hydroxyacylglutathione hydrolase GloB [Sodalis sp. Fle]|nr:MAG: hydroxyacylglutathione hydrolase GloB [Sodalis sp. Fle]
MNIISIPALTDNYIWLLHNDDRECMVVDPGEAVPVLKILVAGKLTMKAIVLTHHHHDHVGGVRELLRYFSVPTYGPQETKDKGADRIVAEGDNVTLLDHDFRILALPGHTLGHIGFYSAPLLFCGDIIFSAGCGQIFKGMAQQMYASFQKINQLPPETLLYGAHEYTLANITFASILFPQDDVITGYQHEINQLRAKNQPTMPTTLRLERQINLFLRCHEIDLHNKLNIHPISGEEWRVFSALRKKKDHFNKFS